jgi:hypothetical protein
MNQRMTPFSGGHDPEEDLRVARLSVFRISADEACCCTCDSWAGLREWEERFFYSLSNVSGTCMLMESYRATPTYGYCEAWSPVDA